MGYVQHVFSFVTQDRHGPTGPTTILVVHSNVLVDGKIEEALRDSRRALLTNLTKEDIKRKAAELQAELRAYLWQNIDVETISSLLYDQESPMDCGDDITNSVVNMPSYIQIRLTSYVELKAVSGEPQPAMIVGVVGDIFIDGKLEEGFRQSKEDLLQNCTPEEFMEKAVQFQVDIEPSLWKNI